MMKKNYSFELENGEWVESKPMEEVAIPYEQKLKFDIDEIKIKQMDLQTYLSNTDKKVTKYRDQLELVELGIIDQTELSEEDYTALIIERQNKRNLHKVYNQQIYDLENPIVNTEEATPYEDL